MWSVAFYLGDLGNITTSLSLLMCKIRLIIVPAHQVPVGTQGKIARKTLSTFLPGVHPTGDYPCVRWRTCTPVLVFIRAPFVIA